MSMPSGTPRAAVLVLSGSSGRVERDRVDSFAQHGAAALSFRWFGGDAQPPGLCEVPLETFGPALDELAGASENLIVVGASKGAEAALLLAVGDPRIRTVVALAPTSVVWESITLPGRSSWTRGGAALPFVRYDPTWATDDPSPAFRGLYERSLLRADPSTRIPVEQIRADVVVAAGGDDQVWPSATFARAIERTRTAHGLATTVLVEPAAGHRVLFPGEARPAGGRAMRRGGTPEADARLGARVWHEVLTRLAG